MLVISPLLATGVLQPKSAVAQDVPGVEAGKPDYNSSLGPAFTLPQWTDSRWDSPGYSSTIQLADIDGDGSDELLARGIDGMIVETWNSTLGLWETTAAGGPFSDAGGWDKPKYYETIQTGDIDGDGADELLGRGVDGMETSKWDGSGWKLLKSSNPRFSDAGS